MLSLYFSIHFFIITFLSLLRIPLLYFVFIIIHFLVTVSIFFLALLELIFLFYFFTSSEKDEIFHFLCKLIFFMDFQLIYCAYFSLFLPSNFFLSVHFSLWILVFIFLVIFTIFILSDLFLSHNKNFRYINFFPRLPVTIFPIYFHSLPSIVITKPQLSSLLNFPYFPTLLPHFATFFLGHFFHT